MTAWPDGISRGTGKLFCCRNGLISDVATPSRRADNSHRRNLGSRPSRFGRPNPACGSGGDPVVDVRKGPDFIRQIGSQPIDQSRENKAGFQR